MSYFLTEEQQLIRNSVREFCLDPSTRQAASADRKQGGFPYESWKLVAEKGYIGAYVPEAYGGQGYDFTTYFVILEMLSKMGNPASMVMGAHDLAILPLLYWGTEEQKKKYLVPLASGKAIGCGAVTDPAGLNNYPEWGMTVAEDGDDFVINGTKVLVTNAHAADIKIVFGKPSGSYFDTVYIVEKDMPGVETGFNEQKIVPGKADWGTVNLKNVKVPKANRVVDNGFGMYWFGPSFLSVCLSALTLGDTAFEKTLAFCKQRTRYERPLVDLQAVSHRLVNMAINNEISRNLIYNAIRLWDEQRYEECYRLACMSKVWIPEAINKNLHDAAILHGGIGFTPQALVSMMWVSSLQLEIAEMPADVHRDFVAETYGIKPGWKNGRP
ncbi:MAG: acyl-CoA/acyl-ACP dehydrogenase [Syntrophomonadaceae bacterium]|nr:acyl-CoA/acyl-ACP dehydrogenase [Syntrophomonadaceae bacterium]